MPPLSHWPDWPQKFNKKRSDVLLYIKSKTGRPWSEIMGIFDQTRSARVIIFDRETHLWRGHQFPEQRAKILAGLYNHCQKRPLR
jgi:hypothetical protein